MFLTRDRLQFLYKVWSFLSLGWQAHRQSPVDYIHVFGTNAPGFAGVALKWLTGAKLIVELPGAPEDAYLYESPQPRPALGLRRFAADLMLYFTAGNADCIQLLYPWQLRKYPRLQKKTARVVHEFVPSRAVPDRRPAEKYVLMMGFPWYTKGADILIRAFRSIESQFADYRLIIMSFLPSGREYLKELAGGSPRIEVRDPLPRYEDAMELLGGCSVYVSASRTEGLARVLLEAMAARRTIVASAVAGTPHCIRHNDTGLLFRPGDAGDLAEKLSAVLSDPALAARLAERARQCALEEFDERAYVRGVQAMIAATGHSG
jgi:glycosyltransferase involved in cell wall biosynthesis